MRAILALLVALTVIAAPMGIPVAAAAAPVAATADCDQKPCSCDGADGNCGDATACALGCFGDAPAMLAPVHAPSPARAGPHAIAGLAHAAFAIPPPLLPPRI
jgi:hypothetical protein